MSPRRLLLATLLSLAACGRPSAARPDQTRREIESSTARYLAASRSGDAHALALLYDEHAVLMPPEQEPVEGRDSIEAYWTRGLEDGFELHTIRIETSAGLAYSIGRWSLPATDDESADSGKLVLCWKRIGGQWKLVADIWNSSVPTDSSDEPEPPGMPIPIT
jgi:ketosteroid isomerase-like protein